RVIYIALTFKSYVSDAVEAAMTDEDREALAGALAPFGLATPPERFKKIEAGRRLWNFSTKEPELWRGAL
ncbi:MAG: hypothetical protein ACRDYV_17190, partial [Acidimicrobiia bacterium]